VLEALVKSMLLNITHRTRYDYDPAVATAHHILHLTPPNMIHQEVIAHSLNIEPYPGERRSSVDIFGNISTYVAMNSAHEFLDIIAMSQIVTNVPAINQDTLTMDWPIEWGQVQAHLEYRAEAKWSEAVQYLFASPMVPIHSDLKDYAAISFNSQSTLLGAVRNLMERIHHEFIYESKSTDVNTPVLKALAQKKGVCQDFAHVMLGCCRSMGLAARYVSGYLLTLPPAGQARLIGGDASHAWVSIYCPTDLETMQGVWFDFDPTNNKMGLYSPGNDYVTLATGRDYSDVSPVRGVIQGSLEHTLKVEVTVEPF
jgi:transglutaminase-like putative cysteine protease